MMETKALLTQVSILTRQNNSQDNPLDNSMNHCTQDLQDKVLMIYSRQSQYKD